MATGQMPFHGDTSGVVLLSILQNTPPAPVWLNPDIPEELERIINKCLEKERELRYQHASDIRTDLKRLLRESTLHRISGEVVASRIASGSEPALQAQASAGLQTPPRSTQHTPGTAQISVSEPVTPKAPRRRMWIAVFAATALVIAAAVGIFLFRRSQPSAKLTDADTIVLADFTNTTGDSIFDGTLRQGLQSQLEQSPFLRLVGDDRLAQTLALMSKPKDARLTHQLAREICQRVGGKATIEGTISGFGPYRLQLKSNDCQNGDVLVEINRAAPSKEQILPVLSVCRQECVRSWENRCLQFKSTMLPPRT